MTGEEPKDAVAKLLSVVRDEEPPVLDLAQTTAEGARIELQRWMAHRLAMISREQRLLGALVKQLEDAERQKDAAAVARYLAQGVHIVGQVCALRGETPPVRIEHTGSKE